MTDPVRDAIKARGERPSLDAVRRLFPPTTGDAAFDPVVIKGNIERLATTPAVNTGHPFLDLAVAYYGPALSEYGQILHTAALLHERMGGGAWWVQAQQSLPPMADHLAERCAQAERHNDLIPGIPEADVSAADPNNVSDASHSENNEPGSGVLMKRSLWLVPIVCTLLLSQMPVGCRLFAPNGGRGPRKRIAAIVTTYSHNSHADIIATRLFRGHNLDDTGPFPRLQLASLYTDQVPEKDISRAYAAAYGFPIAATVEDALTLGTGRLAVDGVLLIAEHGDYPRSATTSIQYPKRRLFEAIVRVFRDSGRVVPVYVDKHLADNWDDAKWIADTAREMGIPLMAGSSLPVFWRHPPTDVRRQAGLKEVVALSYHTLDAYGFHALEMVQCLVERRRGGETGIRAVQCLTNEAVWQAIDSGRVDRDLLGAALDRCERRRVTLDDLPRRVKAPILFVIDYADGLRAHVLTLNGAVTEWSAAWRTDDGTTDSTLFWEQDGRPGMHFGHLLAGIETMMWHGTPTWPADRTLLTSGTLDALLISRQEGGRRIATPQLTFAYTNHWSWCQPPPPPPTRPWR